MNVEVVSIAQSRPNKRQKISDAHGIFKERIELKNYSMEEYNSIMAAQ